MHRHWYLAAAGLALLAAPQPGRAAQEDRGGFTPGLHKAAHLLVNQIAMAGQRGDDKDARNLERALRSVLKVLDDGGGGLPQKGPGKGKGNAFGAGNGVGKGRQPVARGADGQEGQGGFKAFARVGMKPGGNGNPFAQGGAPAGQAGNQQGGGPGQVAKQQGGGPGKGQGGGQGGGPGFMVGKRMRTTTVQGSNGQVKQFRQGMFVQKGPSSFGAAKNGSPLVLRQPAKGTGGRQQQGQPFAQSKGNQQGKVGNVRGLPQNQLAAQKGQPRPGAAQGGNQLKMMQSKQQMVKQQGGNQMKTMQAKQQMVKQQGGKQFKGMQSQQKMMLRQGGPQGKSFQGAVARGFQQQMRGGNRGGATAAQGAGRRPGGQALAQAGRKR